VTPEEFQRLVHHLRVALTAPRLEMRPPAIRVIEEAYLEEYRKREQELVQ
jgi:hypothetical protein